MTLTLQEASFVCGIVVIVTAPSYGQGHRCDTFFV